MSLIPNVLRSEIDMVENPERENLDKYFHMYSRNPYCHASVERIVLWALHGKLEAIAEDTGVKQHFQNLLEETNLDLDTYSILTTMLVFGDAYVRLVRNDEGDVVRLHHLSPRDVEIKCDEEGNVTEFIAKFGDNTFSYSPKDVLHFRWKPQPDTPYGISILKGLEPIVERESRIMSDFLRAFEAQTQGRTVAFDWERSLKELKAIPFIIAKHTQVPIGLLTMKIENEDLHELQMKEFEELCQNLRDVIRKEIMEKIIKPETERKGFREVASLGWKRKNKPTLHETERIIEKMRHGTISLEEARKQLGLTEYYV